MYSDNSDNNETNGLMDLVVIKFSQLFFDVAKIFVYLCNYN